MNTQMIEYPEPVQEKINFLEEYKINDKLKTFNILHMYPKGLSYPNGYWDAREFDLVIFNFKTMEKRTIEDRDGINMCAIKSRVLSSGVFADGSFFIRFTNTVKIEIFQCVMICDI